MNSNRITKEVFDLTSDVSSEDEDQTRVSVDKTKEILLKAPNNALSNLEGLDVEAERITTGSRYFSKVDISVVCYRCGGVGHMSRSCTNAKKEVCFLCGRRDHQAEKCPYSVLEERKNRQSDERALGCFWCATSDHHFVNCSRFQLPKYNPKAQCIVCQEPSSFACSDHLKASKGGKTQCVRCCRPHVVSRCKEMSYRNLIPSFDLKGFITGHQVPTCHKCNKKGHMSAFCNDFTRHILNKVERGNRHGSSGGHQQRNEKRKRPSEKHNAPRRPRY